LTAEQMAQKELDTVLLLRQSGRAGLRPGALNPEETTGLRPDVLSPGEITAVTIPWLQDFGWVCEEANHTFVICRKP